MNILMDKQAKPTSATLNKILGESFVAWESLVEFCKKSYPAATEDWHFAGVKYGWSFRIKDKKRVLIYLLPGEGNFRLSMVFGQKATDAIMESDISETIKTELRNAKVYAEGRGIRIDVTGDSQLHDLKMLIEFKIAN